MIGARVPFADSVEAGGGPPTREGLSEAEDCLQDETALRALGQLRRVGCLRLESYEACLQADLRTLFEVQSEIQTLKLDPGAVSWLAVR